MAVQSDRKANHRGSARRSHPPVATAEDSPDRDRSAGRSEATRNQDVDHRRASRGVEQLLVLSLALVFAACGLFLHVLWIVAVVLMALLWGYLASELGSSRRFSRGSVVSDVVTTIVEETRDLAEEVSNAASEHGVDVDGGPSSDGAANGDAHNEGVAHAEGCSSDSSVTKKELYEEARDAGIEGRSTMSKAELQKALEDR